MIKVCVGMFAALAFLATAGCASGVYYPFGTGKDANGNPKPAPAVSAKDYNQQANFIVPS